MERVHLDCSDLSRGVTVDAAWFMECIHNLPATGTPLFIGQCIGEGIADALQRRMPHIFGELPAARTQQPSTPQHPGQEEA